MESNNNRSVPLSDVVADCVKRWFKDTLRGAKSWDVSMQVLVSQMYYSGYGIPRYPQKGRLWMTRASRVRSSAWKVSDKRQGSSPWDQLFGGGNSPALAVAAFAAFAGGILAIVAIPRARAEKSRVII